MLFFLLVDLVTLDVAVQFLVLVLFIVSCSCLFLILQMFSSFNLFLLVLSLVILLRDDDFI